MRVSASELSGPGGSLYLTNPGYCDTGASQTVEYTLYRTVQNYLSKLRIDYYSAWELSAMFCLFVSNLLMRILK